MLQPSHSCSITSFWDECKSSNGSPNQGFVRALRPFSSPNQPRTRNPILRAPNDGTRKRHRNLQRMSGSGPAKPRLRDRRKVRATISRVIQFGASGYPRLVRGRWRMGKPASTFSKLPSMAGVSRCSEQKGSSRGARLPRMVPIWHPHKR